MTEKGKAESALLMGEKNLVTCIPQMYTDVEFVFTSISASE
ncbi:hypothetical protein [Methanosarcina sp.]|nr:hypothetical protein [Methanosarcina sp.]MDY9925949.1 hypothetical protein [Methanosarcina sp.]